MKISLNIKKGATENDILTSFNNYFTKKSPYNIIKLVETLASYYIGEFNISNLTLKVEGIYANASYCNYTITIDKSIIKRAKKTDGLPTLIKALMHELGHIIIEQNNKKIIETKTLFTKYLPIYKPSDMQQLFLEVFGDLELAIYARAYYYFKSENEKEARRFADFYCKQILNKYASNIQFNLQEFEQQEKLLVENFLANNRDFKYYYPFFNKSIKEYQIKLLNLGLKNLNNNQITNLLLSVTVIFPEETKALLFNELCLCGKIDIVKQVLESPVIELSNQQAQTLQEIYGSNLKSFLYANNMENKEQCR